MLSMFKRAEKVKIQLPHRPLTKKPPKKRRSYRLSDIALSKANDLIDAIDDTYGLELDMTTIIETLLVCHTGNPSKFIKLLKTYRRKYA